MINIGFVGDIFPGGVLVNEGGISEDFKLFFNKFDLRVGNLESALYDGKAECHVKMSDPKLGNLVFSPESSIKIIKDLNIDVVSLANNHVCDCDYEGLARTIEILDKNGIAHFGAGRTEEEAKKPAIVHVKGKSICFLGYFPPEWEAPYPPHGDIGGLNQLISENVIADIKKYKAKYDYVFVMPHWGKEHTIYPLQVDVKRLHEYLKAGADGILGAHSHCPQTSFVWNNQVISMSMGNLLFPDRYIISPRKTYYPTNEELNRKEIPITYKFPFVDKLTMVKMTGMGRVGLICSVILDDKNIKLKKTYTILDANNVLRLYKLPAIKRIRINTVQIFVKHRRLYSLFCKVMNKFINKFTKIKYRYGGWNLG